MYPNSLKCALRKYICLPQVGIALQCVEYHPWGVLSECGSKAVTLTLSQCTLAGPVCTGMPLECHWLIQCTLGNHWATQRIFAGYTGTPLEKLSWNSPTLECHWRNLVESAPHWDATGETLTFAAYAGTPLEGLWQPTHAPTHIVKHAEKHPCQFEMTRWRDTSKQVDRSLYIQPLLGVYCPAMKNNSALNTCDYFNITLCMLLIWAPL